LVQRVSTCTKALEEWFRTGSEALEERLGTGSEALVSQNS
jgi:hypothetical protein